MTWYGYGVGWLAPGITEPDTGVYGVAHNVLLAHATAWRTYDRNYRPTQKGRFK
jgi:beta-glucosidase